MFNYLKCLISDHKWEYKHDIIDGWSGANFGKTYKCIRCSLVKSEMYDGRIIIEDR